jgi:hypothetical protein
MFKQKEREVQPVKPHPNDGKILPHKEMSPIVEREIVVLQEVVGGDQPGDDSPGEEAGI